MLLIISLNLMLSLRLMPRRVFEHMRRFIVPALTLILALTLTSPALAVNKGNTGCGFGYFLFKDASDSFMTQLLATTTNSFGTQTSGILTGSFHCRQPRDLVGNERLNEFVDANMDGLASDIAAGRGETLDTLALLMEVPESGRDEFFSLLRENFDNIFSASDVESTEVIDNIIKVAG